MEALKGVGKIPQVLVLGTSNFRMGRIESETAAKEEVEEEEVGEESNGDDRHLIIPSLNKGKMGWLCEKALWYWGVDPCLRRGPSSGLMQFPGATSLGRCAMGAAEPSQVFVGQAHFGS